MNVGHVEDFVLPLEQKILDRLGITTGHVEFHQEEASYGFTGCDTCDPPEEGFSITVDGNQVWPTEEADGWTFMDGEGTYNADVIDYAERLAREIMYATKNTTPDTCEH